MITIDFSKLKINNTNQDRLYKILDVGCGTGRHICGSVKFKNIQVIGVDINIKDLKEAQNKLFYHEAVKECFAIWDIACSDILKLPFKDNTFDIVICSEVLEHIQKDKMAIQELIRVLKHQEDLIISVPRYLPEKICWILSKEYRTASGGHIRIYKKNELIKTFENLGLKKWHCHYAHGIHTPYWWLKCLLGVSNNNLFLVSLYHKFLVWDIMKKPKITKLLDKFLSLFIGKSLVVYFKK